MIFTDYLLGALLAVTGVQASPSNFGLRRRDVTYSNCVPLYVGNSVVNQAPNVSTVCIDISGSTVNVKYGTLPSGDAYNGVKVYLGTSNNPSGLTGLGQLAQCSPSGCSNSKNGLTPSSIQCSFSGGGVQCTFQLDPSWSCGQQLYIATEADLVSGTAWGEGDSWTCFPSKSKGNCWKYWPITLQCTCPEIISYEPSTFSTTCYTTIPITTVTVLSNVVVTTVAPPAVTTSITVSTPTCPAQTPVISTTTAIDNPLSTCPAPTCTQVVFTVDAACPMATT